jgi:hypothetical protein
MQHCPGTFMSWEKRTTAKAGVRMDWPLTMDLHRHKTWTHTSSMLIVYCPDYMGHTSYEVGSKAHGVEARPVDNLNLHIKHWTLNLIV